MKKFTVFFLGLLALTSIVQAQTATIRIDAGLLERSNGTTPVPVGGLLQLIASPSGTFTAPTSSSYVAGDNVLVSSFAMNTANNTPGETFNVLSALPLSTSSYTLTPGEALLLRFYPDLSFAAMPSTPTLGTSFGQVRSSTVEFGPAIDPSETAWIAPGSGATVTLDYITVSDGGTYANATAFATGVVSAVPEPSTTGLIGGLFVGLVGLAKLRRRQVVF